MKKILSLALASAMVVAALPVAYAAENEADYTAGTQITYMGTQEVENGGAGDVWTVTVPAKMVPGDKGTVKAEGMWNSNKFLAVTCPETIALTYGAQSMDVAIEFGSVPGRPGFTLVGNSETAVSTSADIKVAEASRLFGTWEGILEYSVLLCDQGDANQDGMITEADATYVQEVLNGGIYEDSADRLVAMTPYADVNGDGEIKTNDSTLILQTIEGDGLAKTFWTNRVINE